MNKKIAQYYFMSKRQSAFPNANSFTVSEVGA